MKKRTVGEMQALRAASRFMLGLGVLAIIVSVSLMIAYLKLAPDQKNSPVHQNDPRNGGITLVVAVAVAATGWKLRSYLRKCEEQTGQSSKPFGWMP